jgi:DNA-directed RNA polymerase specialized sigma24 family protein
MRATLLENRVRVSLQPFPTTRCSVLEQLSSTDDQTRSAAYNTLVRAYWQPIYTYLRLHWRFEPADAQDTTQAFLGTAWNKGYFESFDPARARFRTFLRVCLDRFVQSQQKAEHAIKRGGSAVHVALEFTELETALASQSRTAAGDTHELFDREYVRALFARAVASLRRELHARGRDIVFDVFDRYDLAGAEASYAQVADELGISVTQVTNHLHAARQRFRALVLDEIRALSSSEAEFRAEARELLGIDP